MNWPAKIDGTEFAVGTNVIDLLEVSFSATRTDVVVNLPMKIDGTESAVETNKIVLVENRNPFESIAPALEHLQC